MAQIIKKAEELSTATPVYENADVLNKVYDCVDLSNVMVAVCSNDYDRHHDVYHVGEDGWSLNHRVFYTEEQS